MNGWRYEWIQTLPQDVYDVLIEEMNKKAPGDHTTIHRG